MKRIDFLSLLTAAAAATGLSSCKGGGGDKKAIKVSGSNTMAQVATDRNRGGCMVAVPLLFAICYSELVVQLSVGV